jgi:hypothetical protein
MDRWMDGYIDGWMDIYIDRWMDNIGKYDRCVDDTPYQLTKPYTPYQLIKLYTCYTIPTIPACGTNVDIVADSLRGYCSLQHIGVDHDVLLEHEQLVREHEAYASHDIR